MSVKVDRTKGACSTCEQPFKGGAKYVSRIYNLENGWKRFDYCGRCIDKAPEESIAEWKVEVIKHTKMVLSESAIWQVLSSKDTGLGEKPLTYILCLMMMRKRKLRCISTKRVKGKEVQTYENKSRKVHLKVVVPPLGPAAFAKLQDEITDFFSGEEA
jgi:hypothetical protein